LTGASIPRAAIRRFQDWGMRNCAALTLAGDDTGSRPDDGHNQISEAHASAVGSGALAGDFFHVHYRW